MAERRRQLRRALAREDGIALIFAVQVLVILTLLVAAGMAAALSLKDTTERDYHSKQALAAALSGIDVARYRVNKVSPGNSMCVTDRQVASGSGGQCPAYQGDLGNGVTYGYTVSPAPPHQNCGGVTIAPGDSNSSRCITSSGTADGVTRRVQALIRRGTVGTPLFPLNGIVGLDGVKLKQTSSFPAQIRGDVGTNGVFDLAGCPSNIDGYTGFQPGPTATLTESCAGSVTSSPPRATPWTLAPLDSIYSGTQTTNDNAVVFGVSPNFSYNASTRTLLDNGGTMIISGANPRTGSNGIWTFNFCKLAFTDVTEIKLQNGAVARFLIDSNQRPGSGCSTGASLSMTNVSGMNYDTTTHIPGNPAAMQFMYYGTGQTSISNQSGFSASFYAPDGDVKFTNKTTWVGGIAAKYVETTNGLNFTSGDVSGITAGDSAGSTWTRTSPGFVECRPLPTSPSDQESGC